MIFSAIIAVSLFQDVKLKRVIDGDTIVVDIPGQAEVFGEGISVRVQGIDTPELSDKRSCMKARAREARDELRALLNESDSITLTHCTRDKFFRLLCVIKAKDDVGNYMLDKGLAKPYSGGTKLKWVCK